MNTPDNAPTHEDMLERRIRLLRAVYSDGPQPVVASKFEFLFSDVLVTSWCRMVGLKYEEVVPSEDLLEKEYIFSVDEDAVSPDTEEDEDDSQY